MVLGQSLTPTRDRPALLGLTARSVATVELRYADGRTQDVPAGDGGFVLVPDSDHGWSALTARDAAGRVLETVRL